MRRSTGWLLVLRSERRARTTEPTDNDDDVDVLIVIALSNPASKRRRGQFWPIELPSNRPIVLQANDACLDRGSGLGSAAERASSTASHEPGRPRPPGQPEGRPDFAPRRHAPGLNLVGKK